MQSSFPQQSNDNGKAGICQPNRSNAWCGSSWTAWDSSMHASVSSPEPAPALHGCKEKATWEPRSRPLLPARTPSALTALFSGAEPEQSGIWGYRVPDGKTLDGVASGFSVAPRNATTLWGELGRRNTRFSIMNVAFRKDPVWAGNGAGLDFAYDGYRLARGSKFIPLSGHDEELTVQGIRLRFRALKDGVEIRKSTGKSFHLSVGEGKIVNPTRGSAFYAYLPERSLLGVTPLFSPLVRGSAVPAGAAAPTWELNAFFRVRRLNKERTEEAAIPVEVETAPSAANFALKGELLLHAVKDCPSRLVVGYFPVIDELNHAYADLLQTEWPLGRTSRLFLSCAGLVDRLLSRVMETVGPETLLVVSSDHGAVPFHGMLHLNEVFAREGLVKRAGRGYALRQSELFYHPSESGLVVMGRHMDRTAALRRLQKALARAEAENGVRIGAIEAKPDDPFLAFLFPQGEASFDASPPRRGGNAFDSGKSGGHHMSPLCPTPWIQAMLGLWSARSTRLAGELDGIPTRNRELKDFLLNMMGEG